MGHFRRNSRRPNGTIFADFVGTVMETTERRSEGMTHRLAALVLVGSLCGGGLAVAQDSNAPAPGLIEVTYMPAGAGFVPAKNNAPSFGNIGFGTSVTLHVNRYLGVEGEVSTMIATTSDFQFGDISGDVKAPNMLNYTGNVVVTPFTFNGFVPYATVGVGGLTMFERPELGVRDDQTFLSGNAGGGLKWYAPNNRWGIRGDYRFGIVKSKDSAPAFFGRETRNMHRVYGGVIVNMGK
jgi:Outer membrane protein beta-barrel domain